MSGRDYDRLDPFAFGEQLVLSGDLDPVYLAARAALRDHGLARFLVAYWCFYDAGLACWMAERGGAAFWAAMMNAAANEAPAPDGGRWPRGKERRHFRGVAALDAVQDLANRYRREPGDMVAYCAAGAPDLAEVMERTQQHRLFGPWIAFKVADMLERVVGERIDFGFDATFFFKDPQEGALLIWRWMNRLPVTHTVEPRLREEAMRSAVAAVGAELSHLLAPPTSDRPIGLQEIETVCCKWKSHINGHYPLHNDIREIRHGLARWVAHSEQAAAFLAALPALPSGEEG